MSELRIRPYTLADESDVLDLWRDCHLGTSANTPRLDIQRKLLGFRDDHVTSLGKRRVNDPEYGEGENIR